MTALQKFSREGVFEYVDDYRFSAAQKKCPLDKDNRDIMIDKFYSINNVPAIYNLPTAPTEAKFDVSLGGSDSTLDLEKSGLIIGFNIYKKLVADPFTESALNTHSSVPWNTLEYIRSINIKASDASEHIQMYDDGNDVSTATEHAILMEYGDVIDDMDDVFFTPTCESILDDNTTASLSLESQSRSTRWCGGGPTGQVLKFLPLGMIFNSIDKQLFLKNLKKIIISLYFKPNNTWANFSDNTLLADAKVFVNITKCELLLVQSKCTGRQEISNINSQLIGTIENLCFLNRVAIKQPFKNTPLQLSPMVNLNMISMGIKAVDYAAKYCNPCQYMPLYVAANEGLGLSSISVSYGSITVPSNAFVFDSTATLNAGLVELYQMYRACAYKSGTSKDIKPAIPFRKYKACYSIIYFPLYDTLFLKETSDNRRVQINMKSAFQNAQKDLSIVLHTIGSVQLFPDGTVSVIKSTY